MGTSERTVDMGEALKPIDDFSRFAKRLAVIMCALIAVAVLVVASVTYVKLNSGIKTQQDRIYNLVNGAVGPAATAQSKRNAYCFINHVDYDTGHAPLDKSCPPIAP